MESETVSIQKLFQDRRQFRIPFFQRNYVWNRDDQWERLWSDISGKADLRIAGNQTTPHFLGATVVEPQLKKGLLGVDTLHVIDGQQRLTTLQYVLTALAISLRAFAETRLLTIVEGCLRNGNETTMNDPEIEAFKVWPTFRDRDVYRLAMTANSLDDLRERFPTSFTQSGTLRKIGMDHPPSLEAIWFFATELDQWARQGDKEHISLRLSCITEAILSDIHLVSISLGPKDDAQVIFETLNGHGAQLHAIDLIRNFIFMRADRETDAKELFQNLWSPFEGGFWVEEQRRGRLVRPRLEWFMHSALQAELVGEIDVGRLYVSYRQFAMTGESPKTAKQQLEILNTLAGHYQKLMSGIGSEPIARFGFRIRAWDASTTHSLALKIASSKLTEVEQNSIFNDIVSYLVRRSVCGLTTKNYNNIFASVLKKLSEDGYSASAVRSALSSLEGEATRWPRDEEFLKAWLDSAVYPGNMDAQRTKSVLAAVEAGMRSNQSEELSPANLENLDVDHVLPSSWFQYWPLSDGTHGQPSDVTAAYTARVLGQPMTPKLESVHLREAAKVTLGNLTLLHYGANRSLQHHGFVEKRAKFFEVSNLHLNRALMIASKWDENAIRDRGAALFKIALKIWAGPTVLAPRS
ncbi:MAG: DUF262 domain-containing protein [Reyranella sp.]|uniref:DUF262 domain-containing protein n=1 Tax=Reyranella sp. TaxID=1929291 RepID=UPI0011FDDFB7|nr:DUF262 domain-containing HNH endonuclease family protein [Reyranella sp.]TAJ39769.1 MAG: DUF262 domain-containing protein [Reyranella sp.]